MDCTLSGSSVQGILQARILEWIAIPFSRDPPDPGIEPTSPVSPAVASRFFTTSATWENYICLLYLIFKKMFRCLWQMYTNRLLLVD